MKSLPPGQNRTKLTKTEYARVLKLVSRYLKARGCIRNRELRKLAGIGYDQAIHFFNTAISQKHLVREGSTSGCRYILKAKQKRH